MEVMRITSFFVFLSCPLHIFFTFASIIRFTTFMKHILFILSLLSICAFPSYGKGKQKPVYVFGVSTSFTDSIVYRTEIQLLDSVYLDENKFLPERYTYSYQMKNYLEYDKGLKDRTCAIYFNNDRAKLNKALQKLLARFKKSSTPVQIISASDFQFKKE